MKRQACRLLSLKIITKMQDSSLSSHLSIGFCKNHPSVPSGYFIADQPWVKYCRNCALNVALSGRRIDKELTPEQFDRKMQISTVVQELRGSLSLIDQTADHYRKLTDILEEVAPTLTANIADVEAAMRQLEQAKDKLQGLYARQVGEKVHVYYEKQSKMAMLSMQVKKELQIIESNYGNLIEMQQGDNFQEQRKRWEGLLDSYRKETLTDEHYNEWRNKILTSIDEFYNQVESLSRFTIDIRSERGGFTTNNDQFDITLTPIDGNSLVDTVTFEQLRLNLKPRGPLKLKTNKKVPTQRDSANISKVSTKRPSICTDSHLHTIRRG